MTDELTRREALCGALAAGAALGLGAAAAAEPTTERPGTAKWSLCLNTSTIRPAPLEDKIRIAAEAGYDGIELWTGELETLADGGGDVAALGRRIRDLGLFVPNVIGLWDGMPAEAEAWEASLVVSRRRMELAAAAGARYIAALPLPDRESFDLGRAVEQYRALLALGREYGIGVAFEFVGFFKGVHRLGQAAAVALDADDPDARLVADTFHLHRGGSGFRGVAHLRGEFYAVFHWNDVPDGKPASELSDADRIYPGDGVLPLVPLLRDLDRIGFHGPLSLELFHREHWEQDPRQVAETGLRKMRALIEAAGV